MIVGKATQQRICHALIEMPGLRNTLKGEKMELIKFILWLSAGAVIGWFASRIVTTENGWTHKPVHVEDSSSEES